MADVRWVDVDTLKSRLAEAGEWQVHKELDRGDFDAPAPPALDREKVLAFLESAANESNVIPNHYGSGLKHAYSRTRDNVEAGAFELAPGPPPAPWLGVSMEKVMAILDSWEVKLRLIERGSEFASDYAETVDALLEAIQGGRVQIVGDPKAFADALRNLVRVHRRAKYGDGAAEGW